MAGLPQVNYDVIEQERLNELQARLNARLEQTHDWGAGDTLRQVVLTRVSRGDYESAEALLLDFVASKSSYPNFQAKVERYKRHAQDLIKAIQSKRSFAGLGALPLAKQQEIYDKVLEHFDELKAFLQRIEVIEKEIRLEDIRSTTWFLKALVNATFFVVGVAFLKDVVEGLGGSFHVVFASMVSDLSDKFLSLLGL